jgi:hypothetical protein
METAPHAGKTTLWLIVFRTRRATIQARAPCRPSTWLRTTLSTVEGSQAGASFFVRHSGVLRIVSYANERVGSGVA